MIKILLPYILAGAVCVGFCNKVYSAESAVCTANNGNTEVTYTSAFGSKIVFQISGRKQCYRFINGDVGVVGPVTIIGMSPAHSSTCSVGEKCHHGWMLGLPAKRPASRRQGLDSRDKSFHKDAFGGDFPITVEAPASLIKAKSDTVNRCPGNKPRQECLQYAAVLTVLDKVPYQSEFMFRPPMHGRTASVDETKRWRDLNLASIPKLDRAGLGLVPMLEKIRQRFVEVQLEVINNYQGRKFHAEENFHGEEYHGKIAATNAAALSRLALNDVDFSNPVHRSAAANLFQYGYDLLWMYSNGGRWGGHSGGRQALVAVVAGLFEDPELVRVARLPHGDRESNMVYRSDVTKTALFGAKCREVDYWSNQRTSKGSKFCRDPYGYIDGPDIYMSCCLHGTFMGGSLVVYLYQMRYEYNRDAALEYGARRYFHGAWSKPDPCLAASAGGGILGPGECIPGEPSRSTDYLNAAHGTNANKIIGNGGMFHRFLESMKRKYFQCASDGFCPGMIEQKKIEAAGNISS